MSSAQALGYEIFDVFAQARYAGNPLAVVYGGAALDGADMQAIARELNLSETSFVLCDSARDGAHDVRIFTPRAELPYAGHPTLGTAFAIHQRSLGGAAASLVLRLGIGDVRVRFEADGLVWLDAPRASFGAAPEPALVAAALGIAASALDPDLPLEVATTGHHQLLVPLRDLAALRACRIDSSAYRRLRETGATESLYAFTRETRDQNNHFSVRLFAPDVGVAEDPATGSAAGWLAAYASRHRLLGKASFEARIEQGHEISRPSLLHVRASEAGENPDVSVGGRVIRVARGELLR